MKRFITLLLFTFLLAAPAHADWRWSRPEFKKQKVVFYCDTMKCIKSAYIKTRKQYVARVHRYDERRLKEWRHWTSLYIPNCTWYGESGVGPEYAAYRYTIPNSSGSEAYGKFQMMPPTYHDNAKYHDWSALDQEIAARREYWQHGTSPWTNC